MPAAAKKREGLQMITIQSMSGPKAWNKPGSSTRNARTGSWVEWSGSKWKIFRWAQPLICLPWGWNRLQETPEQFSIGAMVTLRELEQHAGLAAYAQGAFKEALRHIVGVQLRNLATVGGSIYSRFGFSDLLTLLLAMDCDVELYKGGILPLREYAQMPYDRDILVRLILHKTPAKHIYQSVRPTRTDLPVLTCAAARTETGFRFALGARPQRAVLFTFDEGMTPQEMAAAVQAQIQTGSNMRGSAEYRRHLAGVLVRRAAEQLA